MGLTTAQEGLNLAQDDEAEMETALLKAHLGTFRCVEILICKQIHNSSELNMMKDMKVKKGVVFPRNFPIGNRNKKLHMVFH